jgi:hypothetical protein
MAKIGASRAVVALAFFLFVPLGNALAEEGPPAELLGAIEAQLQKLDASAAKGIAEFAAGPPAAKACGMQHFAMTLSNRDKTNSFAVLLDPQSGSGANPKQLMAVTRILHVDADGSPRGYHPADPAGKGNCVLKRNAAGAFLPQSGVCALDPLANAGVRLFSGERRLTGTAFAAAWPVAWNSIAARSLRPLDPSALGSFDALKQYYGFYWAERKMTVLFKKDIILPAGEGYPCIRNERSHYPGYFVAATTLAGTADGLAGETLPSDAVAPAECRANRFIDAERVPFFVIPGGGMGEIGIGDIAVVYAKVGGVEKIVYAIIADSGPSASFGEGSIALNQILLGQEGRPVMNNAEANKLDIGPSRNLAVGVLLLGGTRQLLNGDYSLSNIERVGREQLSLWSGAGAGESRLRSCAGEARPNP